MTTVVSTGILNTFPSVNWASLKLIILESYMFSKTMNTKEKSEEMHNLILKAQHSKHRTSKGDLIGEQHTAIRLGLYSQLTHV